MRISILLLLLALTLSGCFAAPIATPTPAATATAIPIVTATPAATPIAFPTTELAPGGSVRIEIPTHGTPEASPRMIVSVKVFDEATGAAINDANIYWAPGPKRPVTDADIRGRGVFGADLYLDGEEDGWLIVRAPGYVEYSVRLKYRIVTSRWLDVPVRLKRIGEGGV